MDSISKELDLKLCTRKQEPTAELREGSLEQIELVDADALACMRSREREQTVLYILDESPAP